MPTNLSDALGIGDWIFAFLGIGAVWYYHHYRRLMALNSKRPKAVIRIHDILTRYDNAGYAGLAAYLRAGLGFAGQFAMRYWFKCPAVDCGFTLVRMFERLVIWPYYAWTGMT